MISAIKRVRLSLSQMKYSVAPTGLATAGLCWSAYVIAKAPPTALQVGLLLLACYFLTDLISGLLHVVLDNPRSLDVKPLYSLAIGFQRHHENPRSIFEMSLFNHLYVMHLPLTFFFLVVALLGDPIYHVSYLIMFAMLHLMQMAHRWSHQPEDTVPGFVARLQKVGVLLDRPQHQAHHTPPYDKNHCIMTGLANPVLNAFVRRLGGTSHWWNAAFLGAALMPLGVAYLLQRFLA